ncbi:MAG: DUF1841 family protein [Proteobacteria bacterium]|nr:DUF1841 family protein [Pseudomonadota bacterium]
MADNFLTALQKRNRNQIQGIWEKAKKNDFDGLNDEDEQFAKIMLEHKDEFHNSFESANLINEYDDDGDCEINPFFHIAVHAAVENQLSAKDPIEAHQFYNAVRKKKSSHHNAVHLVGSILSGCLFDVAILNKPFDNDRYCALLKKYKNRKPEKIPELVDREFEQENEHDFEETFPMDSLEIEEISSAQAKKQLDQLIDGIDAGDQPIILKSKNGNRVVLVSVNLLNMLADTPDMDLEDDMDEDYDLDEDYEIQPLPLSGDYEQVHQFKIALKQAKPPIWRRIQVPSDYTFWDLHMAIQDAMGWMDSHFHTFAIRNPETDMVEEIGVPNDDFAWEDGPIPGWTRRLSDYFSHANAKAEYVYDFGDGWEHSVLLEKTVPREKKTEYPVCLKGKRACPPEDSGGIQQYEELLEVLADPNHKDHQDIRSWLDEEFDPEHFDTDDVSFEHPRTRLIVDLDEPDDL